MVKETNKEIVEELVEKYKANNVVYYIQYQGVDVGTIGELRAKLKESNSEMKVYKNTFSLLAAKEIEASYTDDLSALLKGPTATIFNAEDPIAPAKILLDFIKENDVISVKAGVLEGSLLEANEVASMAKLPSKEILIGKLLMLLNSPISGFVNVLQGNIRNFAQVINAIKEKKEVS